MAILILSLMLTLGDGLVHTVYFWLKPDATPEQRERFHQGLKELVRIDDISQAWVGVPASTRRPVIDSSYDFSLTMVFETEEAQDRYQAHEDHLLFIERYSMLWERVVVYDAVPKK